MEGGKEKSTGEVPGNRYLGVCVRACVLLADC